MKNDTISRLNAIVSIRTLYPDMPIVDIMDARKKWREKYAAYIECENILRALPPATSAETVTEFADKCQECGSILGRQMKQKTGQWIPVSERLPEGDEYVLCCDKDGYIAIGFISKWHVQQIDGKIYYGKDWCFDDDEVDIDVIAWMPLPKPYKPEKGGEKE